MIHQPAPVVIEPLEDNGGISAFVEAMEWMRQERLKILARIDAGEDLGLDAATVCALRLGVRQ